MKIRCFSTTDTLWIDLRDVPVAEAHDFDDATLMDVDESGAMCAITIERAPERADIARVSYERIER